MELGFKRKNEPCLGRLSAIADYGGKTRVIALGDYVTQITLKPIGDALLSILKGMKGDATHSTTFQLHRINRLAKRGTKI